ncbi:hypothetical protein ACA910_018732 [Epithemia clementina (nom. ined.)]
MSLARQLSAILSGTFDSTTTDRSADDETREPSEGPSPPFPIEHSCLEGTLKMRKGRATGNGSVRWKEHFVQLRFHEGGSISVFDTAPPPPQTTAVPESSPKPASLLDEHLQQQHRNANVVVYIPSDLPWSAMDVHNSDCTFAIEIPTKTKNHNPLNRLLHIRRDTFVQDANEELMGVDHSYSHPGDDREQEDTMSVATSIATNGLHSEMVAARKKGRPVRIYFKCTNGSGEKALWLDAFSVIDRFSRTSRRTFGLRSLLANNVKVIRPHRGRARNRAPSIEEIIPSTVNWMDDNSEREGCVTCTDDVRDVSARINQMYNGMPMKKKEQKEFKVSPGYAYPHRWMSIRELYADMILQSTTFHDLRDPDRYHQEIGTFRVEVLQCIGLPCLDLTSDTDAVVYLVCGPHAFATDVIPDRTNPMWLRKTRRACIFPIYHGYARLFVGVFDDDGEKAKDDFAGRVVVDLARLRPKSTYDVLLPLRQSSHAYTRRPRGAIRLRFTLDWKNDKDVLLSYIPKNIRIKPPTRAKPDYSTTIPCADPKAFRNVAITVHGVDMPGRFKLTKIKAAIKEVTFTLRYLRLSIQQEFKDTKAWMNPTMSGYLFSAWMHCIYKNSVSLVPAYFGLYVMLQLIRTYAIYAVERQMDEGFVAPTWEELLKALLLPRSKSSTIEPLKMQRESPDTVQVTTHQPFGRFLFKCLGFIPWDDDLTSVRNLHLEFPFADGDTYDKYTVRECIADVRQQMDENQDDDTNELEKSESSERSKSNPLLYPHRLVRTTSSSSSTFKIDDIECSDGNDEDELGDENDEEGDSMEQSLSTADDVDELADTDVNTMINAVVHNADVADPFRGRKDQDLDWRAHKSGKSEKLADNIENICYKLRCLTWHSFNDRVYDIKDPKSSYFFEARKTDQKKHKKKKTTLNRKLNKLLGVGEFSHVSSTVSRLGLLVEPFVGLAYEYLCAFRAGFNIATWQDPYLTFLLFMAIAIVTLLLFLIPWRPVLFAVGVWFVGPQNWVIRKLRERGTLPPLKPKVHKEEVEETVVLKQENIFHSHKRLENTMPAKTVPKVDPMEVQHIVVPYGHFMYQRFYDWPPEQQYATVVPEKKEDELPPLHRQLSLLNVNNKSRGVSNLRVLSMTGEQKPFSRFPRIQSLRRRLKHRSNNSKDSDDLLSRLSEGPECSADDFEPLLVPDHSKTS